MLIAESSYNSIRVEHSGSTAEKSQELYAIMQSLDTSVVIACIETYLEETQDQLNHYIKKGR